MPDVVWGEPGPTYEWRSFINCCKQKPKLRGSGRDRHRLQREMVGTFLTYILTWRGHGYSPVY